MKAKLYVTALACVILAAIAFPASSQAQEWPGRPVKFIVPFPPGGSLDPVARLAATRLTETLKQPFIVENRPGAAGVVGTLAAAQAPADGYTFLFVFDTHAVNPAVMPKLPYDTLKDFTPVMLVATAPMAIVTRTDKPYKTFDDIVKAARRQPESVSYGTMRGTLGHLIMTLLEKRAEVQLLTVPYNGGAPMMQGAIGGQVDLAVGSPATVLPHVSSGTMRALAVTGDKRSEVLPEVPTLSEQGFDGFSAHAWWAVFAPTGTPAPIVEKLHAELAKTFALAEVRRTLTETLGLQVVASSPEELNRWLRTEMAKWGQVVKDNNIKAE